MEDSPWDELKRQISSYLDGGDPDAEAIEEAVAHLGDFAWELGPFLDTDLVAFALSPGWNRDLLARAEASLQFAPHLDGVIFTAAKPPKVWDGQFELETKEGPIEIDSKKISYDLALVKNDEAALSVCLDSVLKPWVWDIVNIFVDSEVGEANKIKYIQSCEVEYVTSSVPSATTLREVFFEAFPRALYAEEIARLRSH